MLVIGVRHNRILGFKHKPAMPRRSMPTMEKHGSNFERAVLAVVGLTSVSSKRSPIAGYNHNVQYRGLIFHIQTEDSGLKAPHVFTHLFHGGVIVSTRKLVYDSGTVEEGIKSLMQSQHKAVMKELRKGTFDTKIDEYLGDAPGLLPAGGAAAGSVNAGNENPVPDELGLKNPGGASPASAVAPRLSRDTLVDEVPLVASVTSPSTPNVTFHAAAADGPAAADAAMSPRAGAGSLQPPNVPIVQPKTTLLGAGPPGENARRRSDSGIPLPPTPVGRVSTEELAGALSSFGPTPTSEIATPRTITPARVMQRPSSQRPAMTAPEAQPRTATSDISVGGSGDVAEIHSPAMPSVEPPPGSNEHRIGEYAQHRRRPSSQVAPFASDARSQTQNSRDALSALVQKDSGKRTTGSTAAQQVVKPPTNPSLAAQRSPTSPSIPAYRAPTNPSLAAQRSPTSPSIPVPRSPTSPSIPVASNRTPPPIPGAASRERSPSIGSGLATPAVQATKPAAPASVAPVAPRPRTPTPARVVSAAAGLPRRRASTGAGVVMSKPAVVVGTPSRNSPVHQSQSQPRVRSAREVESSITQPRAISERSLDEVILAYLSEDSKNQT